MMFEHLVIVLPGISGSVLSKDGKEVWGTSTAAIWRAVTSGGESIRALAIKGVDDPSLDDLGDGVKATGLVQDLHIIPGLWKIDGYTGLVNRLQSSLQLEPGRNLFEFAYDWRRDNRVSARKLAQAAKGWLDRWRATSGASEAKLVLVAHSMGGLVSQYFLEVLGGWKDTRALVTFGTPYRGSLNALGYLANGFSEGVGPLKVDLTSTLATFTAVYQLLPAFECVDRGDGKLERIGEIAGANGVDPARARRRWRSTARSRPRRKPTPRTRPIKPARTPPFRSSAWPSRRSSRRRYPAERSRFCAAARARTTAATGRFPASRRRPWK